MDIYVKAMNGGVRATDSGLYIKVASREAEIPYGDIICVDYKKGTGYKEGAFSVLTKTQGNLRLKFDDGQNEEYGELKKDVLSILKKMPIAKKRFRTRLITLLVILVLSVEFYIVITKIITPKPADNYFFELSPITTIDTAVGTADEAVELIRDAIDGMVGGDERITGVELVDTVFKIFIDFSETEIKIITYEDLAEHKSLGMAELINRHTEVLDYWDSIEFIFDDVGYIVYNKIDVKNQLIGQYFDPPDFIKF